MKNIIILIILIGCSFGINNKLNAQQRNDTIITKQVTASIGGLTSGMITKDALLMADSVICSEINSKIISFTMTILKNGNLYEQNNIGNTLTAEMKKHISEMKSGNKIFFEKIKVRLANGSYRTLNAIALKLK